MTTNEKEYLITKEIFRIVSFLKDNGIFSISVKTKKDDVRKPTANWKVTYCEKVYK